MDVIRFLGSKHACGITARLCRVPNFSLERFSQPWVAVVVVVVLRLRRQLLARSALQRCSAAGGDRLGPEREALPPALPADSSPRPVIESLYNSHFFHRYDCLHQATNWTTVAYRRLVVGFDYYIHISIRENVLQLICRIPLQLLS